MRCPAIEGIETSAAPAADDPDANRKVECVAPLLRGLKPDGLAQRLDPEVSRTSNALPRY